MKTFLAAAIPFGLFMGLFFTFQYGIHWGIIGGISSGVIFGLLLAIFVANQSKKLKGSLSLRKDEELIKEGGANHFVLGQATGGWLSITNKRLVFKSHSFNLLKDDFSIDLDRIKEAKGCMMFKIVPNGLLINTLDGTKERFVVSGRRSWIEEIIKASNKLTAVK